MVLTTFMLQYIHKIISMLMSFPDYLFYRFVVILYNRENLAPARAAFLISLMYFAAFSALGLSIICYFVGGQWIRRNLHEVTVICIVLWACLSFVNYVRYKDSFPALNMRWGSEKKQISYIKTTVSFLLFIIIIFISFSIIRALKF